MERLKKKHFGLLFQLCFLCLVATLLSTTTGSVFLLVGIFSRNWEVMEYNVTVLREIKFWKNNSDEVEPQDPAFHGKVARLMPNYRRTHRQEQLRNARISVSESPNRAISPRFMKTPMSHISDVRWQRSRREVLPPVIYLVPMRGGMLKYCVDLEDDTLAALQAMGFFQDPCTYYLKPSSEEEIDFSTRPSHYVQREHASMRIHNLALSCSLVCTIVLCSAALLGAFGVTRRQLSAVLITGVMYMLAAVFGLFALCMMYFKRRTLKDYILHNDVLPRDSPYIAARQFTVGNSLYLSITGVTLTTIAAVCWMILSKLMRYNTAY